MTPDTPDTRTAPPHARRRPPSRHLPQGLTVTTSPRWDAAKNRPQFGTYTWDPSQDGSHIVLSWLTELGLDPERIGPYIRVTVTYDDITVEILEYPPTPTTTFQGEPRTLHPDTLPREVATTMKHTPHHG